MIRRCFNDSAFLWQRACRGWPPRRPASVSSGGGECIERPAAILVDTQPRFSGMNFSVCALVYIPMPFSRSPFYSLLCHSSSLMHTRAIVLSFVSHAEDEDSFVYSICSYIYHFHLCLVFPQLGYNKISNNATLSILRFRHEASPNIKSSNEGSYHLLSSEKYFLFSKS